METAQEDTTVELNQKIETGICQIASLKVFWEKALWADETKLELLGKVHQLYGHRRKNETY